MDLPDIQPEGLMYEILRKTSVRKIPHCLASGDILSSNYHTTKTAIYPQSHWACHSDGHFIPHWHYSLTLDTIGDGLMTFTSSYEMVTAVRDALIRILPLQSQGKDSNTQVFLAHMDAYHAEILCSDFSPGNIIIDLHGGQLIDWDFCKPLSLQTETPRHATQTVHHQSYLMMKLISYHFQGTWQFMSARMIGNMTGPHNYQDNLKSSIYVLMWVVLMYSKCSNQTQVLKFLRDILDPQPIGSTGSYCKADFLKGRTFLQEVEFLHCPALHKLISELAYLFAVCYEAPPTDNQRCYPTGCWRSHKQQGGTQTCNSTMKLKHTSMRNG